MEEIVEAINLLNIYYVQYSFRYEMMTKNIFNRALNNNKINRDYRATLSGTTLTVYDKIYEESSTKNAKYMETKRDFYLGYINNY